ncbi:MAG TPA: hypothetical protein PK535_11675 [Synergistaceae bacterium]|nr:hypothetical protein [Synergistaceae bacterium]
MRRTILLVLLTPSLVFAQARFTVESSQFIPQSYYVGDRVELRVLVRGEGYLRAEALREIPAFPWGEIHGGRILPQEDKFEIRITFTAYQTGTQTLPPLQFGDATLDGLKVHIRSLVDEGRMTPAQPRGQLLLPSTRLYIGLVTGGFLALPLLGAFLMVWVRPRAIRLAARYRERRPYRRFRRDLQALAGRMPLLDARSFYIALLDLVRGFLSRRCGVDCAAFTTRELGELFDRRLGAGREGDDLLRLFVFGDLVKFGGGGASLEKRSQHADLAAETAAALMARRREDDADL